MNGGRPGAEPGLGEGRGAPLLAAVGLLTVLPMPARARADASLRWAAACFPLVGLLVGVLLYGPARIPLEPPLRAALVLLLWVGLTGGLHEDGWADSMDALFAHVSRNERLRILTDPRIGAHALTGTVLLLLVRYGALVVAPAEAVLAAPVLGRWVMALSLARAPRLKETGLGARFGAQAGILAPTAVAAGILVVLGGVTGTALLVAAGATAAGTGLALGVVMVRRLGGLSGDGHGAVGLASETAALVILAAGP